MAISNYEIKEAATKYVELKEQGKESKVCYDLLKEYVRGNYSSEINEFVDLHYLGNGFEDVLEDIMDEIKKQVEVIISQRQEQLKVTFDGRIIPLDDTEEGLCFDEVRKEIKNMEKRGGIKTTTIE